MTKTYKVCYTEADAQGIAMPMTIHGLESMEEAEERAEFIRSLARTMLPNICANSVKIYEEQ